MAIPEFTTEELESEEWRPVAGYEGSYFISNLGRLKGARRSRKTRDYIYSPGIDQGYYRVSLYKHGKPRHFCVHQLVAMSFLGPRPEGNTEINHIDTNKLNNRWKNLEYCTRQGNATHAKEHGLLSSGERHGALIKPKTPRGERNYFAKLSESQVREIRARWTGKRGERRVLAQEFGVDRSLISLIVKRRIWTHI